MKKFVVGGFISALVTLGWGISGVGQGVATPQGELRVVDHSGGNWAWLDWNVFDHLLEVDKEGKLVPGLATSWRWLDDRTLEVNLREGVKFHNDEIFDAEIVKLNWQQYVRYRQPNLLGTHMNFTPGSRLDIIDAHTVRFTFPEPDGAAVMKLTHMHIANRQFYQEFGWGEKRW